MSTIVAATFCFIVAAAATYPPGEKYSGVTEELSGNLLNNEEDTVRNPKVYPLKYLNSVLAKLLENKRSKLSTTTKKPTSATTITPVTTPAPNPRSKIQCKTPSDLIIIFDDSMKKEDDLPKLLDFLATVAGAWRANPLCHISLVPQSNMEVKSFIDTKKMNEYKIKKLVYEYKFGTSGSELVKALTSVEKQKTAHDSEHLALNLNVLLLTAKYESSDVIVAAQDIIDKLNRKSEVNTVAIGLAGAVDKMTLKKFVKTKTMDTHVKLLGSFDELKDCYEFLEKTFK